MVIGEAGFRKVVGLLEGASEQIGREINPHVFTPGELKKRIAARDHFVSAVMGDAGLFIKGGEIDLDEKARSVVKQQEEKNRETADVVKNQ
jgi:hypothetical protein